MASRITVNSRSWSYPCREIFTRTEVPLAPAEALHRLVDGHAPGVFALDLRDHVAGTDSQSVGGRSLERGHDGDVAVDGLDRDTEAVVLPLLPLLKGREIPRLVEVRVRIESPEHLADRGGHQAVGLDVLGVVLLDGGEDLGVEPQLWIEPGATGQNPSAQRPHLPGWMPRRGRLPGVRRA